MAYLFEEMIDTLGFEDGKPHWTSDDHRHVAVFCLLGNPHIRSTLMECVASINAIPQDKIRSITVGEVVALGVPVSQ